VKNEDDMNLEEQEEDTQKGKYLTFILGKEHYGIDIMYVTEIVGLQEISEVPEFPEYMKGIINLRGKIIPLMDIRLRFKKPEREYNDRTCIIVIDVNQSSIGIIVDHVSEVVTVHDENIVPPPNINQISKKYIKGIGKSGESIILLLNCNNLLSMEEIETLNIETKQEVNV